MCHYSLNEVEFWPTGLTQSVTPLPAIFVTGNKRELSAKTGTPMAELLAKVAEAINADVSFPENRSLANAANNSLFHFHDGSSAVTKLDTSAPNPGSCTIISNMI
jgi:hypothetical protein